MALAFGTGVGTTAVPGPAGAARRGPPEGSDAWHRSQRLLERAAPALASARDAWERGDRLRAEWLFGEISLRHPVVGDYVDLMRARILRELGAPGEAGLFIVRALSRYPGSPLRAQLSAELGRTRIALSGARWP